MSPSTSRVLTAPFVWWFASASGIAGIATFMLTMSEDDWHWLGFALPIWVVAFWVSGFGGLVLGLLMSLGGRAVLTHSQKTLPTRRLMTTALVFVLSTAATVTAVISWAGVRDERHWPASILVPACLGAAAAFFWWRDSRE